MIETVYILAMLSCFGIIASFIAKRIERYARKKTRFERHRQAAKDMAAVSNFYNELLFKEVLGDGQN